MVLNVITTKYKFHVDFGHSLNCIWEEHFQMQPTNSFVFVLRCSLRLYISGVASSMPFSNAILHMIGRLNARVIRHAVFIARCHKRAAVFLPKSMHKECHYQYYYQSTNYKACGYPCNTALLKFGSISCSGRLMLEK